MTIAKSLDSFGFRHFIGADTKAVELFDILDGQRYLFQAAQIILRVLDQVRIFELKGQGILEVEPGPTIELELLTEPVPPEIGISSKEQRGRDNTFGWFRFQCIKVIVQGTEPVRDVFSVGQPGKGVELDLREDLMSGYDVGCLEISGSGSGSGSGEKWVQVKYPGIKIKNTLTILTKHGRMRVQEDRGTD
ncbi:hypothetical protein BG011_002371 [Mortierella polycephala]|uniref:Uncharacterized protein n=1 Tax=Mortierella polycephala TaxID=41804 RepID=A0A9P6TUX9_9FUNG|nr:hypothetical protein BG011_002371 [Mortierella polycephala]